MGRERERDPFGAGELMGGGPADWAKRGGPPCRLGQTLSAQGVKAPRW